MTRYAGPREAQRISLMIQQLKALEWNIGDLDAEGADRQTVIDWRIKIDELRAELMRLGIGA